MPFLRSQAKAIAPYLFLLITSVSSTEIFEYHQDFHGLLNQGKKLYQIPEEIDSITPKLELEVEVFAAADMRASADLLYTTTSLLLQQHATLVDVFTKTKYFKDAHIRPSIEILLSNSERVNQKCKRYLSLVKNPQLFQQILILEEITQKIETSLGKYRADIKPIPKETTTIPKASE